MCIYFMSWLHFGLYKKIKNWNGLKLSCQKKKKIQNTMAASKKKRQNITKWVQKDHFKTTKPNLSSKEQTSYNFLQDHLHILFKKNKILWNAETLFFVLCRGHVGGRVLSWRSQDSGSWKELVFIPKKVFCYLFLLQDSVSVLDKALKYCLTILFPLTMVWDFQPCVKKKVLKTFLRKNNMQNQNNCFTFIS